MNTYKKDKWLEAIDVHVALKTTVAYRNAAGKSQEKVFTATFGYLAYFIAKEYADWNTGEGVYIAKSTFAATVGMSRTSVIVPFFQIMEALDLLVKDDSKKKYDSDYYDLRMPRLFPDETDIKVRVEAAKEAAAAKKKDYRARLSSEETVSVLSEDSVCPPVRQCLSSERTLTTNITSNEPSNLTTNKAVADAPSLNSIDNEVQGEDVEVTSNVVVSESSLVVNSNVAGSSFESNEVPSFADFVDTLEVVDSSARADRGGPAVEEDITMTDFLDWAESASEPEQEVAAYGLEHKVYDALQKVVLVAKESTKSEYDWCNNEAQRYAYAEQNVAYDGPGRRGSVSSSNYDLGMEW